MRGKKNKTRERSEAELQYEKIAHTQVEEELWKSEGRFKTLVDNLPQKVFVKDINFAYVACNENYARDLKIASDKIVGKTDYDFFPKELANKYRADDKRIMETGKAENIEEKYIQDGEVRIVNTIKTPVRTETGTVIGILGIFWDITEQKQIEEKLRQSEEKYRSLVTNVKLGIFRTTANPTGKFLEVNPAMEEITGYSREELFGLDVSDLYVNPEERRRLIEEATSATGRISNELNFKKKDGVQIVVSDTKTPVRDGNGEILYFDGIIEDITQHKLAEEKIRHLNLTLRAIRNVNQLICKENDRDRLLQGVCHLLTETRGYHNAWIALLDESGNLMAHAEAGWGTDFAPLLERLKLGEITVCGQQALEQTSVVVTNKPTPTCASCPLADKLKDGGALTARLEHEGKIYGLINAYIQNVFITDEETSLFQEVAGDVAFALHNIELEEKQKQIENALQESEQKLRLMFESMTDGITVTDLNGVIVASNSRTAEIHGFGSKDELSGKSAFELIASYDHERAEANMQQTLEKEAIKNIEYTLLKADGSEFPGELSASILKDTAGNPLGFIAITRDITERKRLEEQRQRTEKLESLGILAGGIAHDFNNLLTGIMGNISLAKRCVESEQIEKASSRLTEAEKASIRARDLTQQLLTFSRGGAPVKDIVSIGSLITEAASLALSGSKVKPVFSIPDDLWMVEADTGQINQAITNIVINADEAMPDGGIVNIRAKNTSFKRTRSLPLPGGDYLEIMIEDHGVGILKKHLPRIFEPYFTTKQKGTGLGLATTYSIIKNHGGYITVDSEMGAGTTFHIYLPATNKPVNIEGEMEEVELHVPGKGRILVMDDEEIIREMLRNMLSLIGYDIELTNDGLVAIECYSKAKDSGKPFDVVIMDLTIPGGMGGKEAIKKLLEIDVNAKVIVSSGYATDPIMSEYKDYGFSAVVTKPYSVSEVEKVLRSVLRRKRR